MAKINKDTRSHEPVYLAFGLGLVGTACSAVFAFQIGNGVFAELCACFGTVLGFALGFLFGWFVGLILCAYFDRRPVSLFAQMESGGPQLVGEKCIHCQKEITSILEGQFCLGCGQPVHHQCLPASTEVSPEGCPRCGA